MTKLRASFNGAREVLTLVALLASFPMLADAGAAAVPALLALLAVLAESGAAARLAMGAILAVLAEAGAATVPALLALLVLRALLTIALYWMWRRGGRRCCQNCAFCRLPEDYHEFLVMVISLLERAPPPAPSCLGALPRSWDMGRRTHYRTTGQKDSPTRRAHCSGNIILFLWVSQE